jgi:hypothetical protein
MTDVNLSLTAGARGLERWGPRPELGRCLQELTISPLTTASIEWLKPLTKLDEQRGKLFNGKS